MYYCFTPDLWNYCLSFMIILLESRCFTQYIPTYPCFLNVYREYIPRMKSGVFLYIVSLSCKIYTFWIDSDFLFLLFYIFQVRNTRTVNRTGQLTGYKLVPGSNCLPLAGPEAKFLRRAAFLKHNLWVTQYARGEDFPGSEFPNQNPRVGEGLASWVQKNRSLEETDIVLW